MLCSVEERRAWYGRESAYYHHRELIPEGVVEMLFTRTQPSVPHKPHGQALAEFLAPYLEDIRRALASGASVRDLSDRYGMHKVTMDKFIRNAWLRTQG